MTTQTTRLEPTDTWQQCCTKIVDAMNALHERMDEIERKKVIRIESAPFNFTDADIT